jgi:hypothetical protein
MQVGEKHDLAVFAAQAPALITQLQGLTIVCSQPSWQHDDWAAAYRPVPLLTAITGLTSELSLCRLLLVFASAIVGVSTWLCPALKDVCR